MRLTRRMPPALRTLLDQLGTLDHVVSMVGGAMGGGFLKADLATIRSTVEEKFFANLQIARIVAPSLAKGGSLTLTAGSGGRPDTASGAIIGNEAIATLVRGLGVELAPHARANAVAPTWTPTPLWRDQAAADVAATRAHFSELIPAWPHGRAGRGGAGLSVLDAMRLHHRADALHRRRVDAETMKQARAPSPGRRILPPAGAASP